MCEECLRAEDEELDEMERDIPLKIAEHGPGIIGKELDGGCYQVTTCGLTLHTRPELMVHGLPRELAATVLDRVTEWAEHRELLDGEIANLGDGIVLKLRGPIFGANDRVHRRLWGEENVKVFQVLYRNNLRQWPEDWPAEHQSSQPLYPLA